MKNIIYIFISFAILSCNGQNNAEFKKPNEKKNSKSDLTVTYPNINLRKIDKTWKSLDAIQKEWIKVEKDKDGYLIYQPCDGATETLKLDKGRLTINWRFEDDQTFELEKFTRLTKNDAFRADCYDVENRIRFEIKAKIVDYKNGIVLWEFNGNKWLMTPKENFKSFRIYWKFCVFLCNSPSTVSVTLWQVFFWVRFKSFLVFSNSYF